MVDDGLPLVRPPFRDGTDRGDDPRVAGVLLAAGTSTRFGDRNKLLVPLDGSPLVRHAARTLVEARLDPVVVVTGYEADRVRAALDGLPVAFAHNDRYRTGRAASVETGVRAVDASDGESEAVVVALGDMPFVEPETVETLRAAYRAGAGDALAAAYDGDRGNPVLFDERFFGALLECEGDVGGREILTGAENGTLVGVEDRGVRRDVDEPSDLVPGADRR